jgi:coproporphyrinogen III oxidase-like Fe-S oxidoreductase
LSAFGIYVHWPFCKAKCPYCDFNSHVRHEAVDEMSFARGLVSELRWMKARTPGAPSPAFSSVVARPR